MKNICFVDLEASSGAVGRWPTELGWAFPFGASGSCLIYPQRQWLCGDPTDPATDWMGWDPIAEKLTGISRTLLLMKGIEPQLAITRFLEATEGCLLFSDAPEADYKWLWQIFDAAGVGSIPTLHDFEIVYADVARRREHPNMSEAIHRADQECPHIHRAEADAKNLARIYELLNPENDQ